VDVLTATSSGVCNVQILNSNLKGTNVGMRVDPVLGVGLYQIRSGEMLGRSFRLADLLRVLPPIRLRDLFVLGHDLGLVWRSGLSTAKWQGVFYWA